VIYLIGALALPRTPHPAFYTCPYFTDRPKPEKTTWQSDELCLFLSRILRVSCSLEAYPVISAPLAVWNLEQFKVETDLFSEHLQQINAQSGAALILMHVGRRVSLSEQTHIDISHVIETMSRL